ncbi:MAG: hypothetical protein JRC91_14590 [Deltaproteobacteria bacterium]|nr:hypothetical protein [Deltaproteobacteria bacterium]
MNLFCKTLPEDLLIQELTDFLFDHRVARIFAHYLETSSKIISGDRANLVLETPVREILEPCAIDIMPGDSLLDMEKEKSRQDGVKKACSFLHADQCRQPCLDINHAATLTATMVSEYFFHAQCQRRFCFKFLGLDSLVQIRDALNHDKFRTLSMDRGILHEKQVLGDLKEQGATLISMKNRGTHDSRFNAFLEQLNTLIPTITSHDINRAKPVFFSQCLLKVDDLGPAGLDQDSLDQASLNMKGTGIPDLLILSVKEVKGKKRVVIEVGDIKSSTSPRFHHKWQVAFYAWLLEKIINFHGISATVAETGFLITRSSGTWHFSHRGRDRFFNYPFFREKHTI